MVFKSGQHLSCSSFAGYFSVTMRNALSVRRGVGLYKPADVSLQPNRILRKAANSALEQTGEGRPCLNLWFFKKKNFKPHLLLRMINDPHPSRCVGLVKRRGINPESDKQQMPHCCGGAAPQVHTCDFLLLFASYFAPRAEVCPKPWVG